MSTAVLDRTPAPSVGPPCVGSLVAGADELLARASRIAVGSLDDAALGAAVAALARVESRAAAMRLALSMEAGRRRVADEAADTGTDAWVARLTGSTREQAAGGLRIARLLEGKYAVTREAFATGELRMQRVRVIVNAAEQAPVEATAVQIREAEDSLVAQAIGAGTRSGRPTDAKLLRQAAHRGRVDSRTLFGPDSDQKEPLERPTPAGLGSPGDTTDDDPSTITSSPRHEFRPPPATGRRMGLPPTHVTVSLGSQPCTSSSSSFTCSPRSSP